MPAQRINPNRVKLHRSYFIGDLAKLLTVHKNTIRGWQREGMQPIDTKRPIMFQGATVRTFLANRKANRKCPCPAGTMYCFRCRAARPPALGMVDYIPISAASGNLKAICATCETVMHRRASFERVTAILPGCDVQIAEALSRLRGSSSASLNCDFERQVTT
jgi:hypothetical protein